jgi:hypothetical protein
MVIVGCKLRAGSLGEAENEEFVFVEHFAARTCNYDKISGLNLESIRRV